MTRRGNNPRPATPSITLKEGRNRLTTLMQSGEAQLAQRPLQEGQEDVWTTSCVEVLKATFGEESQHLSTFIGQVQMQFVQGASRYDQYAERQDAERIQRRIEF